MPPGARVTFAERGGKTEVRIATRFASVPTRLAAEESGYARSRPPGLAQLAALLRRIADR